MAYKLANLVIYMLYQLIHQLLKTGLFKNILESFQQKTGTRDDCNPLKLNFLPRLLLLRLIVIENLCNAHVSSLIHAYRYLWTWNRTVLLWPLGFSDLPVKDVRAHCYCVSLVRTLYVTWHVPRHVFEARAPSRNSIKYRAGDLCSNFICEYFCWIICDPHYFFGRSLSFMILSIILKNKKICVWEVLIISYILFK